MTCPPAAWSGATSGQGPRLSWVKSTMPGSGAVGAPLPAGLAAAAGGSSFGGPVSCSNRTYAVMTIGVVPVTVQCK